MLQFLLNSGVQCITPTLQQNPCAPEPYAILVRSRPLNPSRTYISADLIKSFPLQLILHNGVVDGRKLFCGQYMTELSIIFGSETSPTDALMNRKVEVSAWIVT